MENPDTLVLNLTFLGTVGMALLMFLVLFLLGIITLVIAGIGRLAAVTLMALFGMRSRSEGVPLERRDWRSLLKPARLRPALRTAVVRHALPTAARRERPVPAKEWASAVAEADARAEARARASAPEIKLSVRDLPDPSVPADKLAEVGPLVESALDNHHPGQVPRSFKKAQAPRPLPPLDTGSLVSLSGPAQAVKGATPQGPAAKVTAANRPASKGTPSKGRKPLL